MWRERHSRCERLAVSEGCLAVERNAFPQFTAWFEMDGPLGRHLDLFPSLRVASHSGFPEVSGEGCEAANLDPPTDLKRVSHRIQNHPDNRGNICRGERL